MQRSLLIAGLIVLAVVWILIVGGFVRNTAGHRRVQLEQQLAAIEPETGEVEPPRDPDTSALQRVIAAKPGLWRPLVPAPTAPRAEPDLAKRLADVVARRHQMGSGDNLKVKVQIGKADRRGSWLGKGDAVNGVRIKEITDTHVVFFVQEGGREYTHAIPRQ